MFRQIQRIIHWCGDWKKNLYIGFVFSFFSHLFAAMPIMVAAYTIGLLLTDKQAGRSFDTRWVWYSFGMIAALVILRFFFDYMRSRFQEGISYELVAKDRLAVGDALKRVSLGYFQQNSTGNILNSITTGLNLLENMGIRMIDNFVGGYLNFLVVLICLFCFSPVTALIALAGAAGSFVFLLVISHYAAKNAPQEKKATKNLQEAVLEYAHGLPTVKSFGKGGASMQAMKDAAKENREIRLKIEYGFTPANCGHLLMLKLASAAMAGASCYLGYTGAMEFPVMLMFVFFSFSIFASLEPISDSAHVLAIIDAAMDQVETLKEDNFIDTDGNSIEINHYDIAFDHVDFSYEKGRQILHDVTFQIPEKTTTAIVGPSGSGKSTICNLLARFYDVSGGSIRVGGHDVREFTCDSLLSNISMVFQNVYLFQDTIRNNICFGKPDATEEEMIVAAKKACCHDFIMEFPDGYDTVIGEGGGTLSGGQKQRISIARAMLKDAPVIILDEATASVDPENEHLIQKGITQLTKGKTIITIAHRLATIEQADQILVVDDGTIVQKGTHKELIAQEGKYLDFIKVREQAEGWQLKSK